MPSKSPAQKHVMAGIAHGWKPDDPDLAKIPMSVAKEYSKADEKNALRERLKKAMSQESR
jgi:ribonuclease P protein component